MTVDTTASPNKPGSKSNTSSTSSPAQSGSASSSSHQASFQQSPSNPNVIKKNRNEVIRTIQEITKFDEFTINEAIEACQDSEGRYSMDQVLNILMDEKYSAEQNNQDQSKSKYSRQTGNDSSSDDSTKYLSRGAGSSGPTSDRSTSDYHANIYGASNNLDDDDDFDFDSNSSGGNGSSPLTNSSRTGEFSLIREEGRPPGLKNVGNTCWFNSIIQTFFHLPYFRRLILSFSVDQSEINKLDENSKNVVQFVAELRKLFALMLKSKRKSINPNLTLRCLRSCSKYDVDTFNQEDVSEFATILVNLIEESFDILYKLQNTKTPVSPTTTSIPTIDKTNTTINETTLSSLNSPNETQINDSVYTSTRKNDLSATDSLIDNLNNLNLRTTDKLIINQQLNTRKNRKNPIVNLLNGDMLINRKNNDEDVTSNMIEIFREVNIQMCNARNLHEGLELEWGETSIDKFSGNNNNQSGPNSNNNNNNSSSISSSRPSETQTKMNKSFYEQESWVVKLPSVLFICLNRYKFVKATQSSSKILEPFEFYPHIYLDRYVYANRELVKNKRKELRQLNEDLKVLEEKLNSIKCYKYSDENSSNYFALDDVIKCAYHFATTDYSLNDVFNQMTPLVKPTTNENESTIEVKEEKEKLQIVTNCLKGWITQIESKINDLKSEINKIKQKIYTLYDEDNLKKLKYNLHSVCIHEGNAASGHFWTYIWNTQQKKWFKFNDTDVSESNWDDLYANAVGGGMATTTANKNTESSNNNNENIKNDSVNYQKNNINIGSNLNNISKSISNDRSAYFLVYTNGDDSNLYQENHDLDADLVKLLEDDQEALENQLNSFKLKQILREMNENLKKSNLSLITAGVPNVQNDTNQTCIEHAKAFSDSTYEALSSSFDRILPSKNSSTIASGPDEALRHAVEIELNKYTELTQQILAKLPDLDLRLNHILIYFNSNNLTRDSKILALYDIFRMQILPENNIRLKILQTLAQIKYNEYVLASAQLTATNNLSSPSSSSADINPNLIKVYEKWQSDYRDFRSIIAAFINAVNFMESQRYEEAAQFFCVACEYNERITQNLTNKMKGMDHDFLMACRRKCLKMWNQSTIRKFTNRGSSSGSSETHNLTNLLGNNQQLNQQELTTLIETMISKFLPCLFRLAGSTTEDKAMIEEIRKDWLAVLDSNLPEIQIFHDFMTKLFEDSYANHYHSLNVNKTNLSARYKDVVHTIKKIKV